MRVDLFLTQSTNIAPTCERRRMEPGKKARSKHCTPHQPCLHVVNVRSRCLTLFYSAFNFSSHWNERTSVNSTERNLLNNKWNRRYNGIESAKRSTPWMRVKKSSDNNNDCDAEKWINFAVHAHRTQSTPFSQTVFDLNKADKSTAISKQVSFPTWPGFVTRVTGTHSLRHPFWFQDSKWNAPHRRAFRSVLGFCCYRCHIHILPFPLITAMCMTRTVEIANAIEATDKPKVWSNTRKASEWVREASDEGTELDVCILESVVSSCNRMIARHRVGKRVAQSAAYTFYGI